VSELRLQPGFLPLAFGASGLVVPAGLVFVMALADLLLIDGDPVANIALITDPEKNMLVIMKDGKIYKNSIRNATQPAP